MGLLKSTGMLIQESRLLQITYFQRKLFLTQILNK
jgi:hypothetical protein